MDKEAKQRWHFIMQMLKAYITRRITFARCNVFVHRDERRDLFDITFLTSMFLFFSTQIKVLEFKEEGVEKRLPVGNHYHPRIRWEVFVMSGGEGPLFKFLWRDKGKIKEKNVLEGDVVIIPPGCTTHTFVPLRKGVRIWGLSSVEHDAERFDVIDKIFNPEEDPVP